MVSKRVRMNFSLSQACVYRLRELARTHDRPMSHIVEDSIMANTPSLKHVQSPPGEDPPGGEEELMARVERVLAHIDKITEKYSLNIN